MCGCVCVCVCVCVCFVCGVVVLCGCVGALVSPGFSRGSLFWAVLFGFFVWGLGFVFVWLGVVLGGFVLVFWAGRVFVFTPLGIIIAQFFVNVPFMFRILRGTFQSINPRYEHVAETLGCTEAQAFWRVTLPMSKNGLLAGSIITWSKGIGEFGAALMVAGATRMKTETLPISLFLNMSCGELDLAIAAATILIIISLISLFVFERYGGFTRVF